MESNYDYDVFISYKSCDKEGYPTEDSRIAAQLCEYLKSKGLRVFFSVREQEFPGTNQYSDAVDKALDTSRFLIAVGCSRENLESDQVQYEWSSFLNDIRSDFKRNGEVFVVYRGMKIADLPLALRQQQAFSMDEGENLVSNAAFAKVYNFIRNALARGGHAHSPSDAIDEIQPMIKSRQMELSARKNKIKRIFGICKLFIRLIVFIIFSIFFIRTFGKHLSR